ncbi:hypothetical protein VNO78_15309 [Psophocarpus tetragonolobus]|uniref:Uncharacterized protein n=1 Tax=Psophocarpus tetragonolobus TaxID=3891 RepID=A0AAN9XJI0_PSOTE
MSSYARSISILWMFMAFLLSANNAMAVSLYIEVTNSLPQNLVLNVICSNIDHAIHLMIPDTTIAWDFRDAFS